MLFRSFTPIDAALPIGDSLDDINLNYANLDTWLTNVSLSADLYWRPMIEFFTQLKTEWKDSLTLLQQNSGIWDTTAGVAGSSGTGATTQDSTINQNVGTSGQVPTDSSVSPDIQAQLDAIKNTVASAGTGTQVAALSPDNQKIATDARSEEHTSELQSH